MAKLKGQTTSRVIEPGVVIHISTSDVSEAMVLPTARDEVRIIVCGEEFLGTVKEADELYLLISLISGPLLSMEPVPAGHPAHGAFTSPGEPNAVWKVVKIV